MGLDFTHQKVRVLPGLLALILFLVIGIFFALRSHYSTYDYSTFQMYRVVQNHLQHSEITKGLAMTHPADSERHFLYSTLLGHGYHWFITGINSFTSFSVTSLRIASVLAYCFLPLSLLFLTLRARISSCPLLILLGSPALLQFSIACDPVTQSQCFIYLLIAVWIQPLKYSRTLVMLFGFLYVYYHFLNFMTLCFLLPCLFLLFKKQAEDRNRLLSLVLYSIIGGGAALLLSFFLRNFAPSDTLSFMEYFRIRGSQGITHGSGLGTLLHLPERFWGFMSRHYLLFTAWLAGMALFLLTPSKENPKVEKVIFASFCAYFLHCLVLAKTALHHFFYADFYLWLGPVFLWIVLKNRAIQLSTIKTVSLILCFLCLSAYSWRRSTLWQDQRNPLDQAMTLIEPQDYLLRDSDYNTWPVHLLKPSSTLYIKDPTTVQKTLSLKERHVEAYRTTHDTVYFLRPRWQDLEKVNIPDNSQLLYLTQQNQLPYPIVAQDRGLTLYRVLPTRGQ